MKKVSRRNALLATLFGAGGVGLRALATGLPASFLLNPRKAFAGPAPCAGGKAQFVIFNTSGAGDSINACSPGTYGDKPYYGDKGVIHNPDPGLKPASLLLNGKSYLAAKPWTTLPQAALDRTVFFHLMTNTPVHPKEPQVLQLMGAAANNEMLPSLLAKAVAPCLGTIQAQPISIGASNPSEALSYEGATQPIIPPVALKDTLANPTTPLTNLQPLRDQTMKDIYAFYKRDATPAQKAYIDQMALSQTEVRSINQKLLASIAALSDNTVSSQISAAITLIQMKVCPVIAIHIPFGGDNHSDAGLATEAAQTLGTDSTQGTTGIPAIALLLSSLQAAGLQDQVSFISLNVFGRTLGQGSDNGRGHNQNHEVSIAIGKPFAGGVIGGCTQVMGDYGATAIDSKSGLGVLSGGDVPATETLGAFAQTMLAAVGGDTSPVSTGKVIPAALA